VVGWWRDALASVIETTIDRTTAPALPRRVHEVYEPFVRSAPDQVAFVEGTRTWTYKQFSNTVDVLAQELVFLGVRPGDRVMIASENSVALSALLFATSKLDAWGISVNPRLSPRELDQIHDHSGARRTFFVTGSSKDATAHAVRRGASIRELGPFDDVAVGTLNQAAEAEPVHPDGAAQVAALIYTSGTTGNPKGVMLSHANLLSSAAISGVLRRIGPADRIYGVLPMSHIVGFTIILISTLMFGATIQLEPKYDPELLADAIADQGVTVVYGVPATYQRLLAYKQVKGIARLKRGKLRFLGVAGAPLDLDLKSRTEQEFDLPLLNGYGITECSPGIAAVRSDKPRSDESVGPVLPGVEARIVKLDGSVAPPGEVGELHVRGPNVMLGYYRAPDLTAQAIDREGWFNTGDLARFDGDDLFIVGRSKEMIIRSGFNVYPAEVEAVLNSHNLVVQSAVVGRAVDGNEEVVAFVQLLPGAAVSPAEIIAYAGGQLTSYKRPCEVILLDALPASSTGKILKHRLWEAARGA
jgi:long-chain acyl-CoA synthetase